MITDPRLLLLHEQDNVLVLTQTLAAGETITVSGATIVIQMDIPLGHKLARVPIAEGSKIMKYAAPIGSATCNIAIGAHVHVHNIRSDYTPTYHLTGAES